jgi:D-methionine transport system permease protein
MTGISTLLAYIIGLPIGVLLNVTSKKGIKPNKVINSIVGTIVNILRSIPCLLLILF